MDARKLVLETKSNGFTARFCYWDVEENWAFALFREAKLHVNVFQTWKKPGTEYILHRCSIRKKDRQKFLDAIEKLERKMLICGHNDYTDFVIATIHALTDEYDPESMKAAGW